MRMQTDTFLVGYANDISDNYTAVITTAVIITQNTEDTQRSLNHGIRRVSSWLEKHGLDLDTRKTKILLLTRR